MSNEIETGGPAFPNMPADPSAWGKWDEGMTLRDYFAAKAMPTVVFFVSKGLHNLGDGVSDIGKSPEEKLAIDSYRLADAMLAARSKA